MSLNAPLPPNLARALRYLLSALGHAVNACEKTRQLVTKAIGRFMTLAAAV